MLVICSGLMLMKMSVCKTLTCRAREVEDLALGILADRIGL